MNRDLYDWLEPHFASRDLLFATLTAGHAASQEQLSRAIKSLLHRVKRRVLGYQNEHVDLATVVVFERSAIEGFHAHMVLENPCSLPCAKANRRDIAIGQLIVDEWCRLSIGAHRNAQDVQPVYDLEHLLGDYLTKAGKGASLFNRLDINNLCLPEVGPIHSTAMSCVPRDNS